MAAPDELLPEAFRLPTEAEWEFAAIGNIGNTQAGIMFDRNVYPWGGNTLRNMMEGPAKGQMLANFKRGAGDYRGVAGYGNDGSARPSRIDQYPPNSNGLYNMAGNVNEWVMDVYRPTRSTEEGDIASFRGNVFETQTVDTATGDTVITKEDVRDFLDGDALSAISPEGSWIGDTRNSEDLKKLQNDPYLLSYKKDLRVYKGGGWKDMAFWLTPGARRYKKQTASASDIGFRTVMSAVTETE